MADASPKIFVRNDQGQVWGPLELTTVSRLIGAGQLKGRIEISQDGVSFAVPGRFPSVRDAIPRHLWGDGVGAAPQGAPAAPATAASAPVIAAPAAAGPGVPIAGPGARAYAAAAHAAATSQHRPIGRTLSTEGLGTPANAPLTPPTASPSPAPAAARPAAPASPPPAPPARAEPPPAPSIASTVEATGGPPPSGDVSRTSAVHLYYLAASANETGLLTLQLPDRTLEIHFKKGAPEYVGSSHPDDSVGAFLLKQQLINPQQLAQAEAAVGKFGGEVLGALFGLGILNPASAFSQLAQRASGMLLRALLAESGAFTYEHKELAAHKSMPLGNKWAVLSDQVRRIPGPELKKRLASAWELPVMKSGGRVAATDLRLTPQETRALSYLDGVRSLAQLVRDLPQEAESITRVVYLLKELEIVQFAAVATRPQPQPAPSKPLTPPTGTAPAAAPKPASGTPPASSATPKPAAPTASAPKPAAPADPAAAPRPAPAAAPRAPAAPAAPATAAVSTGPVAPENDLAELRKIAARIQEQNKFEVLGLTEKADAAAIKLAYFKLAKSFHPDTVTSDAPPEVAKLKGDIFSAVGEAYRTLSDDKSRAAYMDELKHGSQQVDVAAILQAEELFQKGSIMVKARKFPEAVKMLDDAIKGNPEEGEFYAWRGYAKFFTFQDRKQGLAEAHKDLQLGLKRNERCAPAHYFLGHIAKLCGDNAGATKHFKRAVEIQPDHVDALRELRLLGVRK